MPTNPRAWLESTGRHKAIDTLRRHARLDASRGVKSERSEIIAAHWAKHAEDCSAAGFHDRIRASYWRLMMAIHDWTRLEAGDFQDFHKCWVVGIRNALCNGLLLPDYMAMAEQVTGRLVISAVTSQRPMLSLSESATHFRRRRSSFRRAGTSRCPWMRPVFRHGQRSRLCSKNSSIRRLANAAEL